MHKKQGDLDIILFFMPVENSTADLLTKTRLNHASIENIKFSANIKGKRPVENCTKAVEKLGITWGE